NVDEPDGAVRLQRDHQEVVERDPVVTLVGDGKPDADLDEAPQDVEVGEVEDLVVEIARPWPLERTGKEEPGDHEEQRHAEGRGESDDVAHEAVTAERQFDTQGGVHHDHEDDRQALGMVDQAMREEAAFCMTCLTAGQRYSSPGLLQVAGRGTVPIAPAAAAY